MGLLLGTRRALLGGQAYYEKVLGYGPIAYWPLWEGSGSAATCLANSAQNGTYTGVTLGQAGIGDGYICPLFDGSNDYVNVHSATLNGVFSGAEGTASFWLKVSGTSVWTDSTQRSALILLVDGNSYLFTHKQTTNNTYRVVYVAGGTSKNVAMTVSTTAWFHVGITWSATADQLEMYISGTASGSPATGLGTWSGNLDSTRCNIGCNTQAPTQVWDGYIAHVALYDSALSAAAISDLATV